MEITSKKCNNFSNYSIKTQLIESNNQQNDTNKDDVISRVPCLKKIKKLNR